MKANHTIGILVVLAVCGGAYLALGDPAPEPLLTPAGPPGGAATNMRTLLQVEPRIPVNATTAPGSGIFEHVLSAPARYYLTGDVAVTKPHGFTLTTAGASLDLNGFQIRRASGTGGLGIDVSEARCQIKDGIISGFSTGISANTGDSTGCAIVGMTITGCTSSAIEGEGGWIIDSCIISEQCRKRHYVRELGCLIKDCVLHRNGFGGVSERGIECDGGCTVMNCTISLQTGQAGIDAGVGRSGSTNCTVEGSSDAPRR